MQCFIKENKKPPRIIHQYHKANWDNIKKDCATISENIKEKYEHSTVNELWSIFKEQLDTSINTNIPQKKITPKMKLPWVTEQLRIKINKTKRLHKKSKANPDLNKRYKSMKKSLQSDMRSAYWNYIERMIFDLPVEEPGTPNKKLFLYVKSMRNDSSGVAALRKDGILTVNTKEKANILYKHLQLKHLQIQYQ